MNMKEKTKKIIFVIAEIGTVVWAIHGMWKIIAMFNMPIQDFVTRYYGKVYYGGENGPNSSLFFVHLLFYFLSAVLILYLLRKYERKDKV